MSNSFLKNVDDMFIAAAEHIDLPEGLADKIRFCNATYVTRFGVRLRGKMFTFRGLRATHSTPDFMLILFANAANGSNEPLLTNAATCTEVRSH